MIEIDRIDPTNITGQSIRDVRAQLGMGQDAFWARVGITQSGGSRYESGTRPIPKPIRILLIIAYGTGHAAAEKVEFLRAKTK